LNNIAAELLPFGGGSVFLGNISGFFAFAVAKEPEM